MKVYALYHNYYDYCNSWDTIVQLYKNKDDADFACLLMNDAPHNGETDSWYVEELEVI